MSVEIKKISEVEAILPTHYCVEENGEVSYGDGQVDMGVEWIPVPDGFDFEKDLIEIEDGQPVVKERNPEYVLGSLLDRTLLDPRSINYKVEPKSKLHAYQYFDLGLLYRTDYFKDYDGVTFTNLVLRVENNYELDDKNEALSRETKRSYVSGYLEDNTPIFGRHVKVTKKYYNARTRASEIRRRRKNLIEIMLDDSKILGVGEQVSSLFKNFNNQIDAYVASGDKSIMQTINDLSSPEYSWLDYQVPDKGYTIKDSIIYQISAV